MPTEFDLLDFCGVLFCSVLRGGGVFLFLIGIRSSLVIFKMIMSERVGRVYLTMLISLNVDVNCFSDLFFKLKS